MRWDAEVRAAVNQAQRLRGVTVDPALVHAVIEQETRHGALSIKGTREPDGHYSYGPMQVKDTTASLHGITDPKTLATPSIGIRIGTLELARLIKLFPGDTARVASGYNGGPGLAKRDARGRFPNQKYVDAVLSFLARFRSAAVAAVPALLIAGIALWWWLGRRRRLAWR